MQHVRWLDRTIAKLIYEKKKLTITPNQLQLNFDFFDLNFGKFFDNVAFFPNQL